MIRITCDRCDEILTFDDELAGQRVECPHCGDVNRLPDRPSAPAPARTMESAAAVNADPSAPDRAAARGLPPDSGPEAPVVLVRQSVVRSHPFISALLILAPIGVAIGIGYALSPDNRQWWWCAIPPLLGWGFLTVWVLLTRASAALEITNKRTVLHRGLFSRATSEVLHDHVRNIEITQSFLDRVLRVGKIGISSSGQDGIEVECGNIPNPRKLREIIDLYRPL